MGDNLLENYNPLYDVHLRQYFALPHMQKHLRDVGLLNNGEKENANGATMANHGGEGDLYAQHRAMMDMLMRNKERVLAQLADLQKKLDAAEKVEIYRRIRSGLNLSDDDFQRRGILSRSLSRPARGRSKRSSGSDRHRRYSNSFEDNELIRRIESEYRSDNYGESLKNPRNIYNRLAASVYKFQYLHKLDDRTLLNYKHSLKKQLQKLERFRELSFGPNSVAKHQPLNLQNSWFFRRRSLPSLTSSAPPNTLHQPLRSLKSIRKGRNGKSQSPRKTSNSMLDDQRNSGKQRLSVMSKSRPPPTTTARKLPPLPKRPSPRVVSDGNNKTNAQLQKLPSATKSKTANPTRSSLQKTATPPPPIKPPTPLDKTEQINNDNHILPSIGVAVGAIGLAAAAVKLTSDEEMDAASPAPSQAALSEYSAQNNEDDDGISIDDGRQSTALDTESDNNRATPDSYTVEKMSENYSQKEQNCSENATPEILDQNVDEGDQMDKSVHSNEINDNYSEMAASPVDHQEEDQQESASTKIENDEVALISTPETPRSTTTNNTGIHFSAEPDIYDHQSEIKGNQDAEQFKTRTQRLVEYEEEEKHHDNVSESPELTKHESEDEKSVQMSDGSLIAAEESNEKEGHVSEHESIRNDSHRSMEINNAEDEQHENQNEFEKLHENEQNEISEDEKQIRTTPNTDNEDLKDNASESESFNQNPSPTITDKQENRNSPAMENQEEPDENISENESVDQHRVRRSVVDIEEPIQQVHHIPLHEEQQDDTEKHDSSKDDDNISDNASAHQHTTAEETFYQVHHTPLQHEHETEEDHSKNKDEDNSFQNPINEENVYSNETDHINQSRSPDDNRESTLDQQSLSMKSEGIIEESEEEIQHNSVSVGFEIPLNQYEDQTKPDDQQQNLQEQNNYSDREESNNHYNSTPRSRTEEDWETLNKDDFHEESHQASENLHEENLASSPLDSPKQNNDEYKQNNQTNYEPSEASVKDHNINSESPINSVDVNDSTHETASNARTNDETTEIPLKINQETVNFVTSEATMENNNSRESPEHFERIKRESLQSQTLSSNIPIDSQSVAPKDVEDLISDHSITPDMETEKNIEFVEVEKSPKDTDEWKEMVEKTHMILNEPLPQNNEPLTEAFSPVRIEITPSPTIDSHAEDEERETVNDEPDNDIVESEDINGNIKSEESNNNRDDDLDDEHRLFQSDVEHNEDRRASGMEDELLEAPPKPVDEIIDPITKAVPSLIHEIEEEEKSHEHSNRRESIKSYDNLERSESSPDKFASVNLSNEQHEEHENINTPESSDERPYSLEFSSSLDAEKSYQHDEHLENNNSASQFNDERDDNKEQRKLTDISHQAYDKSETRNRLMVQPSIEITPASEYGGSVDEHLDQIGSLNEHKESPQIPEEENDETEDFNHNKEHEEHDGKSQHSEVEQINESNNPESPKHTKSYSNGVDWHSDNGFEKRVILEQQNSVVSHGNHNESDDEDEQTNEKTSLLHNNESDDEKDDDDDADSVIIYGEKSPDGTHHMQTVYYEEHHVHELGNAHGSNL